jgi:CRISPR/Cas system CMR subunit Cmr6 (Cas7 group RAMP superfamily)
MVYDPKTQKRGRKASCAAIIVEVINDEKQELIQIFSKTYRRQGGQEFDLKDALKSTIVSARKILKVRPASAIVWRDGIGDAAFEKLAQDEIDGIRRGLAGGDDTVGLEAAPSDVPITYIICQKRIATKFFSEGIKGYKDGEYGAPPGTMVRDIQGMQYQTFYINGRAPPFSTPKPVRFIVVKRDERLQAVPVARLTWEQVRTIVFV